MASEFYRTTYGAERGQQRSLLGIMFDVVMAVMTIIVAATFFLTLILPTLDPRSCNELSTLGLIAPFVYVAQAVVTIYWIVRWRPWVAVPMVLLSLVGMFQLSLFYKIEYRRVYTEPNLRPRYEKSALKVLSYNVRSFIDDNGNRCIDSIAEIVRSVNPDIVCLQEMGFSEIVDSVFATMKLKPMPASVSRNELSPAIYSRFPIIKAERIDTMKNFVWVDMIVREDTIRVYNVHLHSTAIRRDDNTYIENHEYLESDSVGKVRSMINRLTLNNQLRAVQADTLAFLVRTSDYPTIICGDFNDTPVSYTYRTVGRNMRDVFRRVGRGYSHTYRGFFDMLRIDYIMTSREFDPLSYEVLDSWGVEQQILGRGQNRDTVMVRVFGNGLEAPPTMEDAEVDNGLNYSDHYPLFVRLRYNGKTN